jgi:tripartite-type tricarboxylate transporter receptor subunit TctC
MNVTGHMARDDIGKQTILAVCTPEQLEVLPNVPTLASSLPGFESTAWHGLFAPAGTRRHSSGRWPVRRSSSARP